MLKELYFDSFNFIPVNPNCEIETFICNHFNSVHGMVIDNNSISYYTPIPTGIPDTYYIVDKN